MGFITYKQYDSRWGSKNYNGSSSMASAGCGPTSCAMIIYGVDGKTTPLDTMKYMQKNGFAIRNNGTAWNGIPSCLKAFGVKDVRHVDAMSDVWKLMEKGYVGVFLFRSGSKGGITWTTSGHYIAVTDYKVKDGKHYLYTRDSGGRNHTGWYCYETQMKGLIPRIWLGYVEKKSTPTPTTSSKISVDGNWGVATTKATQKALGTTVDGIVSSQPTANKKYLSAVSTTSWKFVDRATGSAMVKALQKKVGASVDGKCGKATVTKMQEFLNKNGAKLTVDGYMGAKTVKAWQNWLNTRKENP